MDSDVSNADEKLAVEFFNHPVKEKPYVRIMVPGDKTNVVVQPVGEQHKRRFPRQWLYFQMQNDNAPVAGIRLEAWQKECPEDINPNQVAELGILKFQTAEQIATATDAQLQRIGMGGAGLRTKAQDYLRRKNANSASQIKEETDAKLSVQQNEINELKEQLAAILAGKSEKRGPGRPPKEV